jgi:hypothetical protein
MKRIDLLKKQRRNFYFNLFLAVLALIVAIGAFRRTSVQVYISPVIYVDEEKQREEEKKQEEKPVDFNTEVKSYIQEVFADDERGQKWALFTAWNEGITFKRGYREFDPHAVNNNDIHANGEVGSFGVWQFAKATYSHWCEPTEDWKTNWKAQTRCARKIWDSGVAFSTWKVNSDKFLEMERTGEWKEIR